MYKNDLVKLKEGVKDYWGIISNKIYVVVDYAYKGEGTGEQRMLILRNAKGKKRRYYEHLFEKVDFKKDGIESMEPIKSLMNRWVNFDTDDSRNAYDELKEKEKEWLGSFSVRDKVMFFAGVESVRHKDKVFTIKKIIVPEHSIFGALVNLKELPGTFQLACIEKVVEDGNKI